MMDEEELQRRIEMTRKYVHAIVNQFQEQEVDPRIALATSGILFAELMRMLEYTPQDFDDTVKTLRDDLYAPRYGDDPTAS